jgi:DNA-binding beta-propeller fold protein YncE
MSFRLAATAFLFLATVLGLAQTKPGLRKVAVIELPGRPGFDTSVLANGMLLIAHHAADTVDIFDPVKRRLVAQVRGISNPRGMVVDNATGLIYIATAGTNSITVLNSKGWKVEAVIGLNHAPERLLVLPGMDALLVTNPANRSVSLISTEPESYGRKQAEIATWDVAGRPQQMAWDPQRKVAFLALEDSSQILSINPATPHKLIVGSIKLAASQPTGLVFDVDRRQLYVAVRYAVLQVDADSGNEVSRVPAAAGIDTLWLDRPSSTLYAAASNGSISVIKLGADRIAEAVEFNTEVRGKSIAYDAVNGLVYLTGGREGKSKLVILKPSGAPVSEVQTAEKR